ncbi:MAG: co-chaperone GroES [Ruminococcaceae bacterium]|nr:co-chaperone GroES [Oscillospiraceae bacterium]
MTIKPLADKVVTRFVEAEETTKSGIILTAAAKEKPEVAEVVAVGPGAYDKNGNLVPMTVKVGDKVLTNKYAGTSVKLDGEEFSIVSLGDILAIVE